MEKVRSSMLCRLIPEILYSVCLSFYAHFQSATACDWIDSILAF
jgi:hypothetical protein